MKISQPLECSDSRQKAVRASSGDHEAWQVVQTHADGRVRGREGAAAIIGPRDHISLMIEPDEVAIVVPLRFHELKLTGEAAAQEDEDTSPVEAVVFQHALGQQGTVGQGLGAAAARYPGLPPVYGKENGAHSVR